MVCEGHARWRNRAEGLERQRDEYRAKTQLLVETMKGLRREIDLLSKIANEIIEDVSELCIEKEKVTKKE